MGRSYKWVLWSGVALLILSGWVALLMGVHFNSGPDLSSSEKHLLFERYNPLVVAVHPMPALTMRDAGGVHHGLVVDYLQAIGDTLDVDVTLQTYPDFNSAYDAVQNGAAHMTALMPAPPEPNLLRLSHALTGVPIAVVTRVGEDRILSAGDLTDRRVAVPRGSPVMEHLNDYPSLTVQTLSDAQTAIDALAQSKVDAVVLDEATAAHLLQARPKRDLQIAVELEPPFKTVFVLPGDAPDLQDLINRALVAMDPYDRDAIRRKWLDPKGLTEDNSMELLLTLMLVMMGLFIPVAMILAWNRALRTTVEHKTLALREELSRRRAAEDALKKHKEGLEIRVADRTRELQALELILREINKKMWLEDLIHLILDQAMILFPQAEKGGFLYKCDQSDSFQFKALAGYPEAMAENVILTREQAVHRYTGGDKQLEEGVFLIKHQDGMAGDQQLSNFPVPKAMLAMNLMIGEQLVGFLILDHLHDANAFVDSDIEQLARFREHAISAVARSRLLQRFKDLTDELESKNRLLEEASQRLELLSTTDALTQLKNRRYLQQTLGVDIARSLRSYRSYVQDPQSGPPVNDDISFLLIDLDHFKSVNDTYGHDAGDKVLVQVSRIMMDISRETDTVIRWGGEEFLIVARAARGDRIATLAERLREAVAQHDFDLGGGQTLRRSCSIGYATFPFLVSAPEALSWEGVVNLADKALYIAKKTSRNAWVGVTPGAELVAGDLHEGEQDMAAMWEAAQIRFETSIAKPLVFVHQDT